jgi:hypothetical protein
MPEIATMLAPRSQPSPSSPKKVALRCLIESGCSPINVNSTGSIRVGKVARGVSTFWVSSDLAEKVCVGARQIVGERINVDMAIAALYESARELRTRV